MTSKDENALDRIFKLYIEENITEFADVAIETIQNKKWENWRKLIKQQWAVEQLQAV